MSRILLLLYFLVSPWFYGIAEVGGQSLALSDLLLPVCALTWLAQKRRVVSNLGMALLCFGVAALLSVVAPLAEGKSVATLYKVIRLLGVLAPAVMLSGTRCTHDDWVRYLKAFFVGGGISLAVGVVGFFFQWEPIVATQTYVYDGGAYLHRAGGVFRDSGAYGHLLATWAGCSILLLVPELSMKGKSLVIASVASLGALGLYTSISRSAALNIGAILALALILWPTRKKTWLPKLLAGTAVLVMAVSAMLIDADSGSTFASATDTVAQRLIESFSSLLGGLEDIERASGGRLTTWAMAMEEWSGQPVFGVGYKMLGLSGSPPDNTFVLALCETGMLGFGALTFCFGLIFWKAMDRYSRDAADGRSFLILWTGQLIHSLNADIMTFFGSVTSLLILTLIWYRLASHEPARRDSREREGLLVEAQHPAHYSTR